MMKCKTDTNRLEVRTEIPRNFRDAKRAKKEARQQQPRSADPTITAGVEKAVRQYGEVFRRLADE
jgi:hypothetical protein